MWWEIIPSFAIITTVMALPNLATRAIHRVAHDNNPYGRNYTTQDPSVHLPAFLAHTKQKVSDILYLMVLRLAFLWDMNKTKWCNGFYIEFRQNFAKETFYYDENLKS